MTDALHSLPVAYERSDLVALYELLNQRSRRRFLAALLAALGVDLLLLIPPRTLSFAASTLPYLVLAIVVIGILSSPKFGGWLAHRQMRSNFGDYPYTYTIEPEVFVASAEHWETRLNWNHVPRLEVVEDRLFVFIGEKSAVVVPSRAFPDRGAFTEFVAAAQERWRSARA